MIFSHFCCLKFIFVKLSISKKATWRESRLFSKLDSLDIVSFVLDLGYKIVKLVPTENENEILVISEAKSIGLLDEEVAKECSEHE